MRNYLLGLTCTPGRLIPMFFSDCFFFFQRMMEGGREAASPRKEVQLRLLGNKHLYTVWRKVTLVLTYMHQGWCRGGGVASLQSGQGWTFSHIDIDGEPRINVLGSRMGGGGRGVASQIDAAMSQTTQSQTIHTVGNKSVWIFGSFGLCIEYIFWLNGQNSRNILTYNTPSQLYNKSRI